jgi:hypothetical protein
MIFLQGVSFSYKFACDLKHIVILLYLNFRRDVQLMSYKKYNYVD